MSPTPIDVETANAIAVCSSLSALLLNLKATMDRARTAAGTLGQTIDAEVVTVRKRLTEMTTLLAAADRAMDQAVQAADTALEAVGPAARGVGESLRTMTTSLTAGAAELAGECAVANQAIDTGRDGVNAAAEGLSAAYEALSELLRKVQADVATWHALATVADADDTLEYGIEAWATAQDRLTDVIAAQARALAEALATSADDHGRALLIVVNELIDRCNAAAGSVRGVLVTAPPRLTAEAEGALASFVARLADETAERTRDLGELDRQAMEAQRELEEWMAAIGTTLEVPGELRG